MAGEPTSRSFRATLKRELARWRKEGLVTAEAAAAIDARYALSGPDGAGPLLGAVYILGALLVGGGVISLVAWHWDEMGRATKLAVIGAALLASHIPGYRLWKVTGSRPRLGHALSFLGTLVFGASIGLVAQIFQVSGVWYGMFGAWALGAAAAGVLLESTATLLFGTLLACFVWAPGFIAENARSGAAVAYALPVAAGALAAWRRSRLLAIAAALSAPVLLGTAAGALGRNGGGPVVLAVLCAIAFVASLPTRQAAAGTPLASVARHAARYAFYGVAFVLSFHDLDGILKLDRLAAGGWLACVLPLAGAATVSFLAGARRDRGGLPGRWPALVLLVTPGLLVPGILPPGHESYVATLATIALGVLGMVFLAAGLVELRRGAFWEGLTVVAVVGGARFLELESRLWLKGVGFILCGAAILAAAVAFERRFRREGVSDVA